MAAHKFKIGQKVSIIPGNMRMRAVGEFKVLKLLPASDGQNQYRVKGTAEQFERVVKEFDIERR